MSIDPEAAFLPVRIAVLTISDSRTHETDTSGSILVERLTEAGHILADRAVVQGISWPTALWWSTMSQ